MSIALLGFIGSLFLIVAGAATRWYVSRLLGRKEAEIHELEAQIKTLTRQLKEAQNAPKDAFELADRLRRDGM